MTKRILTATVLTIAAIMQVDAVVPDDNVVISEGKESYRFVQVKGGFEVVHTVADEYLATRRQRLSFAVPLPTRHILPAFFLLTSIRYAIRQSLWIYRLHFRASNFLTVIFLRRV